ncbi:hypothetical protein [Rhodopirellula europaea]|uniref:Uncharacterized protein n=1 Tax=Rhodopirellula europaea SH398 TaxID=1263868 RepID=M5SIY5_9BACT|nr:hypothetical protein [Rhodopirellula europaea]EMI27682.1 hypothetical protein RESH_01789 [Rhodopirellula europaea SH398]
MELATDKSNPTPVRVQRVSVLGKGRAASAELVDAHWADGTTTRCVEKVFAPGRLTRLIYRIAFAAPFAYRSNRHAIQASFYRRRVVAGLLLRAGSDVRVAKPLYVRFDRPRQAWVLAAEWIEGRGPIVKGNDSDEMSQLVDTMRQLEDRLVGWGMHGSGWQVSPRALVSTANLLLRDRPRLRLHDGSNSQAGPDGELLGRDRIEPTIIDLESGIPAVLVLRYLVLAWKQGSVFPFDDLDSNLLLRGVPSVEKDLRQDVERLVSHTSAWKDTEIAPFRKPWRWASADRRALYRKEIIGRWSLERTIDDATESRLANDKLWWLGFWMIGLLPILGRLIQKMVGSERVRRQAVRLVSDSRFRRSAMRCHRDRETRRWQELGRVSRDFQQSLLRFQLNSFLAVCLPSAWHRFVTDARVRTLRQRRALAILTSRHHQSRSARRLFHRAVRRWESRRWRDISTGGQLRTEFDEPSVGVYARGMAKHLAIKTLSPVVSMLKLNGMAASLSGGSWWYAAAPFLILPALRTMVTSQSAWASRHDGTPHTQALVIGAIPTLGSLAFVIQMFNSHPAVSEFLLREAAGRVGRHLPIYGGPDSRTEHAFVNGMDWGIKMVRRFSPRRENLAAPTEVETSHQKAA